MAQSEPEVSRSVAKDITPTFSFSKAPTSSSRETFEDFARPGKRARLEPPPSMTAAAAVADARHHSRSPGPIVDVRTSPNPATQAISALMGVSQTAISNAYMSSARSPMRDPTKLLSEGVTLATQHMHPPSVDGHAVGNDSQTLTSPTSLSSFDTQESIAAPSGITTSTASPIPIDATPHQANTTAGSDVATPDGSMRSYNFPASLLQPQTSDSRRGMSLPHSGLRQNTRSPSSKKHKCPYCGTEFTRHHNLKSHLLTHSQEKPYVCSTCQSRFRRLHDLKRHTKLHTGERPHVCPKCKRKFARGDALARHNKGPGGCAGRRASMGSLAGDDDYDGADDSMDGVMYGEPESMEDVEGNESRGTPSIRRQAPSGDDSVEDSEHYSRLPSTYPPIQGRPSGGIAGGQFPPRSNYGPPAALASSGPPNQSHYPSNGSSTLRPGNSASVFAQNLLTESPKPISPVQPQHRGLGLSDNRIQSPSMPQFQPPSGYSRNMSLSGPGAAPQLPPPHGLNPPDARYTLPSQGAPQHPPTQPSGPPTHMSGSGPLSSHSNSLSSHGQSGPGSGDPNSFLNKDERIWAYVKDLEKRMSSMQDEISSLKSQLAATLTSPPNRIQ